MKNSGKHLMLASVVVVLFSAFSIDIVPTSESLARSICKKQGIVGDVSVNISLQDTQNIKMDVSALPQAIKSAVAPKYVAYAIDEAWAESTDRYKLVLKNGKTKLIVYYSADGEFLGQEAVKVAQLVTWSGE